MEFFGATGPAGQAGGARSFTPGSKTTHLDVQEAPNQAPLGSSLTAEQRLPIANAGSFIFDDAGRGFGPMKPCNSG